MFCWTAEEYCVRIPQETRLQRGQMGNSRIEVSPGICFMKAFELELAELRTVF